MQQIVAAVGEDDFFAFLLPVYTGGYQGAACVEFVHGASLAGDRNRLGVPLAVRRMRHAVEQAVAKNLLGKNILGSDFSFEIRVLMGDEVSKRTKS